MAFTAVHFPMDKDRGQIQFWSDGEELGVASENFFDQFITFDGSDPTTLGSGGNLLDAPPSPSILLDPLNDDLTNSSSSDQGTQSGQCQSESSATSTSLDIPSIPSSQVGSSELSKSVPVELAASLVADPILSGGSISDSELLRLEGISLKSPKSNATAPSTPHLADSNSPSPRKHSRVLDSIYATIRRATHRSKPHKQNPPMEVESAVTMADVHRGGETCYDLPANFDLNDFTEIKLEGTPGPVDSHGRPLSPPHTGRIPPHQHSNNIMSFVSGHFDDPFSDSLLAPPAVIKPASKSHNTSLDTPLLTPALNDDAFYQQSMDLIDGNGNSFPPPPPPQQSKQRSTSSAEWPMEGLLTNDNHSDNVWPSSSPPGAESGFIPSNGGAMSSPGWWDAPQQANGHNHHSHRHGHHNRLHNGASINLTMHNPQAELPYEYDANGGMSGLMIHMPQPRGPQAAVLNNGIHDPLISPSTSGYYPAHPNGAYRHASSSASASSSSSSHYHRDSRRPRPRAPSSGARHYSAHYGGSMSSPRKVSSSSSGAACYTLREESVSPTPGPRHRSSSSSSTLAVRKRRSWTRRHQPHPGSEPRTPTNQRSSSRRSVSYDPGSGRRGSMSSGGGSSLGGGGGAFSIEFCNYTPSDKKVLMNGVAPSGSSKTKARREREARENERKMSEAYIQMIRAAGGDVEKLRENGFFDEDDEWEREQKGGL